MQNTTAEDTKRWISQSQHCSFADLMLKGKYKAALYLISDVEKGGILHLSDPVDPDNLTSTTVREVLISKHPQAQPAHSSCIPDEEPQNLHPIIFKSLDVSVICSVALSCFASFAQLPGMRSSEERE